MELSFEISDSIKEEYAKIMEEHKEELGKIDQTRIAMLINMAYSQGKINGLREGKALSINKGLNR